MKAVILAGGLGTRLSEETQLKPKPMVEIGDRPILWHIMKIFSAYDVNEFIICCGYKGYVIKEYFANYSLHSSDITFDMSSNTIKVHKKNVEPWKITLVDTGKLTMTGGRLKKIKDFLNNETFFMTYGDGVANININELLKFHKINKKKATLTAVKPPSRFGALEINEDNLVAQFKEKPIGEKAWINGGFFVLEPQALNDISGEDSVWEREPLEKLAKSLQISAYKHDGFWQPMDTLRDLIYLNELWSSNSAPWKIW
ncbi:MULTISPECIES: glucose-1-phosphate cytidylyltransferase [Prochlorococcus]|uniref:Glucose-1-phosphate cytidylyltransferase n=1 Tax=Prochlorococcus marinus str. MIT 9314 TaxID=167548 RepID=A0A0A2AHM6_PROMR|nr:glucose-1-phosphate cytidylyltransferase [Prochlorococcus marinus]KGG00317.1 Glucose-1-phosphate cytidylyltransferase [Prochlorococcus marinus str. MIT 9314]